MTQPLQRDAVDGLRTRLVVLLVLLVGSIVLAVGGYAAGVFERAVAPQLDKRTRLIGVIVRAELQRALELGVGLEQLSGLDRYLSDTLGKFDEVERIVVRDAAGTVVADAQRRGATGPNPLPSEAAGSASSVLPILDGNRLVGEVRIDISRGFVRTRLREVLLDVMSIALVAALMALELVLALAAASVSRPLERLRKLLDEQAAGDFRHRLPRGGLGGLAQAAERLSDHAEDLAERLAALPAALRERVMRQLDAQLAQGRPATLRLADADDIRIVLFLFATGTSVALSFLPVFAGSLARPDWLDAGLAAAAPLVSYLLTLTLLTPRSPWLIRRFGARRLFVASIAPVAIGLVGMALATHIGGLTFWRGVVGAAFATATIACQEYAIRSTRSPNSARPLSVFNAVLYSGIFCGAALGGVIAGRFGFGAALVSGAAITALAGLLAPRMLGGTAGDAVGQGVVDAAAGARRQPPRAVALWLGLMLPLSAGTAVVVWYLTPLSLSAAGSGPAEVARVVMLYYLCTVLFGPSVAAICDGRIGARTPVLAGALLAALALLSMAWWSGFWASVALIVGLGIAHTLMRAPLYVLARGFDQADATVRSLRLAERLGAIAGLTASALSLPVAGAQRVLLSLGLLVALGLIGYLIAERSGPHRTKIAP